MMKMLRDFRARKRWKAFYQDCQSLDPKAQGSLLRLTTIATTLFDADELKEIDPLVIREILFDPSIDSLYNLVSNIARVSGEAAKGELNPTQGCEVTDYIRMDRWLIMPETGTLSLSEAYTLLTNKITNLQKLTSTLSPAYVERRCRRIFDTYILFCEIVGETLYDGKTERR